MVKGLKYLYLLVFYNTNFIINCVYLGFYVLPILITLEINNSINLFIILNTTCALLFTSYVYLITYQLNDIIEERTDNIKLTYKNSFMSNHREAILFQKVIYIILILLIIFFSFYVLHKPHVVLFIFGFVIISVIHSRFPFVKPLTIFLERLLQLSLFIYFLNYSFLSPSIYVLFLCYPLISHSRYTMYLSHKRSIDKVMQQKIYLFIYVFYYVGLLSILLTDNIEQIVHYTFSYLLIYLLFSFFIYLIKKTNMFKFVLNYYESSPNQREDLIIMSVFICIYSLHFII